MSSLARFWEINQKKSTILETNSAFILVYVFHHNFRIACIKRLLHNFIINTLFNQSNMEIMQNCMADFTQQQSVIK